MNRNNQESLQQEVAWMKNDLGMIRNAVVLLEQEKDNLRQAVRKLKIENSRVKEKLKKMKGQLVGLGIKDGDESDDDEVDYDDIGKDFILVGGAQDPLSIRYEVSILDKDGVTHKSAERYYWYKMAEKFNDVVAMEKIKDAASTPLAEEAMKDIKGFDEKAWNQVKVDVWETGQRYKLEQVRWIANLLVESGSTYIAVSHQDKLFGTGWRKNREESNKPIFWDGKNLGGKFLMKYRKQLAKDHVYTGPNEKEETLEKMDIRSDEICQQQCSNECSPVPKTIISTRNLFSPRKIYILRHAERLDNVDKNWLDRDDCIHFSRDDSPLSSRGYYQSMECSSLLSSHSIDHIFSSPFHRCMSTSHIISSSLGISINVEPGLCESLRICRSPPGYQPFEYLCEQFPIDREYHPYYDRNSLPIYNERHELSGGDERVIPRVVTLLPHILSYPGSLLIVTHGAVAAALHYILMGEMISIGQATLSIFKQTAVDEFVPLIIGDHSHLQSKEKLRAY